MQPNIYNWINMSQDHRQLAVRRYPVATSVAGYAENYDKFSAVVKTMTMAERGAYTNEWQDWNATYGKEWARRGGIQEYSLKQNIVRKKGGIGAMRLGATSTRPPVQEFINKGWITGKLCNVAPKGVTQSGPEELVPSYPMWVQIPYREKNGAAYVKYTDGNDSFWLYVIKSIPCGGSSASDSTLTVDSTTKGMVKEVQAALNAVYIPSSGLAKLVVDGIPGPKTCQAAHGYYGSTAMFSPAFFESLGLPGGYASLLGNMCGGVSSVTAPVDAPPEEEEIAVEPKKASMGLILAGILAATVIGTMIFKKKKKGPKKAK